MSKKSQRISYERSAGFVIFRQTDAGRLYLVLDQRGHWGLPKGHLDNGETDMQAALRELHEETGIDDAQVVDGFSRSICYDLNSSRKGLIRKTVIFFLARAETTQVRLSDEHVGYDFLPYPQVLDRLSFDSVRQVVADAEALLAGDAR